MNPLARIPEDRRCLELPVEKALFGLTALTLKIAHLHLLPFHALLVTWSKLVRSAQVEAWGVGGVGRIGGVVSWR